MNDKELREAVSEFQKKFGTSTAFIAVKCGVSREHLARWLCKDSYVISHELKNKIKLFVKGK